MSQKQNRLIKCPYNIDKTWRVVNWALDYSGNENHWWSIEEYREQGLLRAILNPVERLKRDIVLNVSIIENKGKAAAEFTETIEVYEICYWVEVRIDEDIYPSYKRNEKPLPIIAATQECIKTALKIQPKDLKSK